MWLDEDLFVANPEEKSEKFYLEKIPRREKKISKCSKKISFFKKTISEKEIYPKAKWFKKFEKYWSPSEENALKELKIKITYFFYKSMTVFWASFKTTFSHSKIIIYIISYIKYF